MELTKISEIHRFIYDEAQIRKFAELIGIKDSIHQMFISARPKYNKETKFRNLHMSPKSFFNADSNHFVNLVKKYEVPVGSYKDGEKPVPNDCLVIYCTTNARCGKRAAQNFTQKIMNALFSNDDHIFTHMVKDLNGSIMASKEKTLLTTMDIDSRDDYIEVKDFLEKVGIAPAAVIETRGGYHVLLHTNANLGEVYAKFSAKHTMGDIFCPIPGTLQGGFPVRFVSSL